MKCKLTIPLLDGKTWETEAEVVGDLALHPSRKNPKGWSVTHVPTLLTFARAVPPEITANLGPKAQRTTLLAWMARVQEDMPKDWLALRKLTAASVRADPDYSKGVRERIRNHCLATKEVT